MRHLAKAVPRCDDVVVGWRCCPSWVAVPGGKTPKVQPSGTASCNVLKMFQRFFQRAIHCGMDTFTWLLCYGFFLHVDAMPLVSTNELMLGMPVR